MTREEAIKITANYDVGSCGYCHQGGDEVAEAFKMAIEALEMQIPKKPIRVLNEGFFSVRELDYKCPNCNMLFSYKWKYCPMCGRALDWKESGR